MPDELRPSLLPSILAAARQRAKLWSGATVAACLLAAVVGYALTPGGTSAHAAEATATAGPGLQVDWAPGDVTAATAVARFIEGARPSPTATRTPLPTATATQVPPSPTATAKPRPQPTAPPRPTVEQQAPPPAPPTATPSPKGPWGLDTSPMDAYSQELFDDTNGRRVASGLAPLRANGWLIGIARIRSQDMSDHDYFAHVSPITGDTAFTLMDKHGVPYGWAGENLAKNNYPDDQTVSVADTALWNSPPHRENILNPNYTDMGIALVIDGSGMKYFTIIFTGPP